MQRRHPPASPSGSFQRRQPRAVAADQVSTPAEHVSQHAGGPRCEGDGRARTHNTVECAIETLVPPVPKEGAGGWRRARKPSSFYPPRWFSLFLFLFSLYPKRHSARSCGHHVRFAKGGESESWSPARNRFTRLASVRGGGGGGPL